MSQTSVVCAYSVSAIRDIFDKGKFKTPVAVETSHVKWVMYSGEVPVPRPGAVSAAGAGCWIFKCGHGVKVTFCVSVHQQRGA